MYKLLRYWSVFKNSFTNVWNIFLNDLKTTWSYIINIFKNGNYLIIFFFFILMFVIFFYINLLFIVTLLWLLYFFLCYFFYKFSRIEKCQQLDFKTYNYISENYTGNLSLGNVFVFFKNFIYYQPKFLAYNYYYNCIKILNKKDEKDEKNVYIFLLIIFLSFLIKIPFRFFTKWLTGFSYFSIKISAICANKMIDTLETDWEWKNFYFEIIETYFQLISSYFFTGLFLEVKNKKIFYNYNGVDITFNPSSGPGKPVNIYMLSDVIKNIEYLTTGVDLATKNMTPKRVYLPNVDNFNRSFNGADIHHRDGTRSIYVESPQQRPIVYNDGSALKILEQSFEGMQNDRHVNRYVVATAVNKDRTVASNHIKYLEKDINMLENDKFIIGKSIILSLFEPIKIITDRGVRDDQYYINNFDKFRELYSKGELNKALIPAYEYFGYFFDSNSIPAVELGPKSKGQVIKEEIQFRETKRDHKINAVKEIIKEIK